MSGPPLQRLAVLGPGTLGLSVAQWAAECGIEVQLVGRNPAHAARGLETLWNRWEGSLRKGRIQAEALTAAKNRLRVGESLEEALQTSDGLLEALPESMGLKAAAWRHLAPLATDKLLWATGSSGIPVSRLRTESGFPLPIVGFHLFLPVHHHRVVELVSEPGAEVPMALQLAAQLQLEVVQAPDQQGYLASRLAMVQGLEAMRMVEQGLATPSAIDTLMARGYGHPCGPLELSDRVGLDLRLSIATALHEQTGNPGFAPPEILRRKVAQGELGRKTGQGFYAWPEGRRAE